MTKNIENAPCKSKNSKTLAGSFSLLDEGFTLIEVLVTITLVALMFTMVPFGTSDQGRMGLAKAIDQVDRAMRFAINESILRNAIVRVKFDISKEPVEYKIQYSTSAQLLLPELQESSRQSIKEREKAQEKSKGISQKFNDVPDYVETELNLPETVGIYSITTSYYPDSISDGEVSIYFYPTGERDSALITIYNDEEIASIDIPPFEQTISDEFYTFNEDELENLEYSLENKAKEFISQWKK